MNVIKILFIILFTIVVSISTHAQTVTNFTLRTVILFQGGGGVTNNITVPTNQFTAIQFAIDRWNSQRTNASPALGAITNYAHFLVEVAKDRVARATNDFDEATLYQAIYAKIKTLSEADKNTIRGIITNSP